MLLSVGLGSTRATAFIVISNEFFNLRNNNKTSTCQRESSSVISVGIIPHRNNLKIPRCNIQIQKLNKIQYSQISLIHGCHTIFNLKMSMVEQKYAKQVNFNSNQRMQYCNALTPLLYFHCNHTNGIFLILPSLSHSVVRHAASLFRTVCT